MDPLVHHGAGAKRVEAGRETCPADDQAAVLALEPRNRPLGVEAVGDTPFAPSPLREGRGEGRSIPRSRRAALTPTRREGEPRLRAYPGGYAR